MQELVGSVFNIKFDIEVALENQAGAQVLPFPGMDKSGAAVCTFYLRGSCQKGDACPFRHLRGDRTVVCKHWLRRLCKKGDDCEFLHEYDMTKMPECYFFSKFGQCGNKDCPFLHIDPEKKMRDCPWYDRGYCRHGPLCHNRHIRRVICQNYLAGFCLDGPPCKYVHPRFDIPPPDPTMMAKKASMICHYCSESGHKAVNCPKISQTLTGDSEEKKESNINNPLQKSPVLQLPNPTQTPQLRPHYQQQNMNPLQAPGPRPFRARRPLEEITCYKCGGKGHFAHRCSKGYLAFLSNQANTAQGQLALQQQQQQQQQQQPPPSDMQAQPS